MLLRGVHFIAASKIVATAVAVIGLLTMHQLPWWNSVTVLACLALIESCGYGAFLLMFFALGPVEVKERIRYLRYDSTERTAQTAVLGTNLSSERRRERRSEPFCSGVTLCVSQSLSRKGSVPEQEAIDGIPHKFISLFDRSGTLSSKTPDAGHASAVFFATDV